jgi:diaminohydroxyphosphoribosylaminopyrimidine deaminase/5-amino-6-(5-phosphoribosylamino)uracil reductase
MGNGEVADAARLINQPFRKHARTGRPLVVMKCAMTLDGKIAAADGSARWITGEAARREAHRMRSQSDAVAVGIGTALADDPALDVRLDEPWPREPYRVVVDSAARLPVAARLIAAGAAGRAVVAVTDGAPAHRVAALEARGATVLRCKARQARVDVEDLCARLFALDVMALLVEGGGGLAAAFAEAGLIDRAAFFVAPKLLGGAAAPTAIAGAGRPLADALVLDAVRVRALGADWLFEGEVRRAAAGGRG